MPWLHLPCCRQATLIAWMCDLSAGLRKYGHLLSAMCTSSASPLVMPCHRPPAKSGRKRHLYYSASVDAASTNLGSPVGLRAVCSRCKLYSLHRERRCDGYLRRGCKYQASALLQPVKLESAPISYPLTSHDASRLILLQMLTAMPVFDACTGWGCVESILGALSSCKEKQQELSGRFSKARVPVKP